MLYCWFLKVPNKNTNISVSFIWKKKQWSVLIEGNEPVIVLNSWRFLHICVAEWDSSAKHAVKTYKKPHISQQIPLLMLNPDKLSGCCRVEENDHDFCDYRSKIVNPVNSARVFYSVMLVFVSLFAHSVKKNNVLLNQAYSAWVKTPLTKCLLLVTACCWENDSKY